MNKQYISQSVKDFFIKLDNIHNQLENFSGEIDIKRDNVFKELNYFEKFCLNKKSEYYPKGNKLNPIEEKLVNTIEDINENIKQWHHQIEKNKKGIKFMHSHEKYLVVMVFGAVKAGKSTLGNFFAGKKFINASFDNEYKHREHSIFATEEKGRDTGGIEKDDNGNFWFKHGVTDTTGAIQYFTLSGLRWMDSPGTGALEKDNDKRNMEEMVNEYIPYTDLCIFLMNSSEPGLMADMKYIKKLSREEQEAIVVITKSDYVYEDEDENGFEIIEERAKTPEDRKMQEDDILQRLHETYPEVPVNKFRAISISTKLANLAIKNNDEQKYKDSNLDKLMMILSNKVSENIIELKEKKPKQNLNNFIESVIIEKEDFKGINELEEQLNGILEPIDEYKETIREKTKKLQNSIRLKIKNEVDKFSQEWVDEVNKTNSNIDDRFLSEKIMKIAHSILQQEINDNIANIIDNYQEQRIKIVETTFDIGGIEKKHTTIKTQYEEVYYETRDPEGILENIRSFFGKVYETRKTRSRTITKDVDLGTNILDYMDKLMPALEQWINEQVQEALDNLQKTYFLPQEEYINQMQDELILLKNKLNSLKFN